MNKERERINKLVNLVGTMLSRLEELEIQVAELKAEKEETQSGIYFEGNTEYKNHIFETKGEK